jgi:hypothetical protein
MPSGVSETCWTHHHAVWAATGALDALYVVWSVKDTLDLPSRRLERHRHVGLVLTSSGSSEARWMRFHAVWSVQDALASSSLYLEHPRRAGLAITSFGTSQACWTHLQAVWGISHLSCTGLIVTPSGDEVKPTVSRPTKLSA